MVESIFFMSDLISPRGGRKAKVGRGKEKGLWWPSAPSFISYFIIVVNIVDPCRGARFATL